MTLHDLHVPDSALVRFVAAGLLATVESYRRGGLPLPRLARELEARTDTLAGLHPPARTLTRLRWLHRDVSRLDAAVRDAGRTELDPRERDRLDATLEKLRDTLLQPVPTGLDADRVQLAQTLHGLRQPSTVCVGGDGRRPGGRAAVHEWVTADPGFGYRMG